MQSLFIGSGYAQSSLPADLVAENARLEKAGTGYSFTEGSSADYNGNVLFTDQPNDKIFLWSEEKGVSLFMEKTERSNGTFFDKDGNLVACADLKNALIRITPDKRIETVYNKGYGGLHFNGPNDLWIDRKGGIYFTDPYYHRNYWSSDHRQELDVQAVYYLDRDGNLSRVIDDLQQPNGIVGTPDGRFLYVADIQGKVTWRYSINADGSLGNKTSFAPAGSDGMTIDKQGNVYLTFGKVLIYNSKGEKLGEIELDESPSNLCFGGRKRDILFITARTSVYVLKMKVKGVE
jgi:gluconolactonase